MPTSDIVTPGYTWDDFVALPEDDLRELVDGQLLEMELPTDLHERIVMLLGFFLIGWARPRRAGEVFGSGYKVRVDANRGIMPDLQFYRRSNLSVVGRQGVTEGRPDLAVEVVSPSSVRHDRVTKLNWYLSLGVPEYWLVNPEAQTLERLILTEGGHYTITHSLSGADVFRPDSFEGLEIPLAELWAAPEDEPAEDPESATITEPSATD